MFKAQWAVWGRKWGRPVWVDYCEEGECQVRGGGGGVSSRRGERPDPVSLPGLDTDGVFVPRIIGNHWKVMSREMIWSSWCFTERTLAAAWLGYCTVPWWCGKYFMRLCSKWEREAGGLDWGRFGKLLGILAFHQSKPYIQWPPLFLPGSQRTSQLPHQHGSPLSRLRNTLLLVPLPHLALVP